MDHELLIAFVAVTALIISSISWVAFLFYSVRRIEKGIVAEGKPRPCQWDPMGFRAFFYAWKVSFPLKFLRYVDDGVIDPHDVKRYSNGADFWLASIFNVASHTFLLMVLVSWVFGL
ncbi:hypothetical protein [Marinimicrobium sp. C2-29]|uniref:hypothetical protein n=1 Tax=Marinimicrobium sp. C2-29 TaxID=3139825 RepID=UPI003138A22F